MFESITKNLKDALRHLGGRGRLSDRNMQDGLREVQRALLEADVNYKVVKDFIGRVREKAVGEKVVRSINPSQQIIKIVHDELVALMGPIDHQIRFAAEGPTVIMMCGLQGGGKTTTCGKLALMLQKQGRKPLLVAADLQRPAAIDQLEVVGGGIDVPVYAERDGNPVKVCRNAVKHAAKNGLDTIILDTAGRLHVDDELMKELTQIDNKVQPQQVFLVCDAMTGQDAVNSAKEFNDRLELDGVILTKLDGDARGGAALSVKAVTGVPIKFCGVGEKLDRIEEFHPDRMAGRILGMGDVVSLVERAQDTIDQEEAMKQQEKLLKGQFTLDDFKNQLGQVKKMGNMKDVMGMIPGMSEMADMGDAETDVTRIQGIINSMTPEERRNPNVIDISRRRRIAAGSGTDPSDVNQLLKQFHAMQGMMKQMASMSTWDRMKAVTGLGKAGAFAPGAQINKKKVRSHRKSVKERRKEKKKRKKGRR